MLCWQDPTEAIDSFQEDEGDPGMEEDESGLSKVKEVLLLERSCARKISKDPSFCTDYSNWRRPVLRA